jgi:hypothetical protein
LSKRYSLALSSGRQAASATDLALISQH